MKAKNKNAAQKKVGIRKTITMTVRILPRESGPLTFDERKQLADFFIALADLNPNKPEIHNEANNGRTLDKKY